MTRRDIRMFMHDVVEACQAIQQVCAGQTLESYKNKRQLRSSVEREFIIIGEALRRARLLDASLQKAIPDIDQIVGFRNNLVHLYEAIEDAVVWKTIVEDVPTLGIRPEKSWMSITRLARPEPAPCS